MRLSTEAGEDQLTGHKDERTHAKYVMATKVMQRIPADALPVLKLESSLNRPAEKNGPRATAKSSMNSERDTRFELATLSLGS